MANPYQSVGDYLQFIRDKYNVQICVKDFGGFIHINKDLSEALDPFLAHTNPFCLYMKSEPERFHVCLSMIRKMHDKLLRTKKPFFGVCHAGLGEYVVPVYSGDLLLGTVNAGFSRPTRPAPAGASPTPAAAARGWRPNGRWNSMPPTSPRPPSRWTTCWWSCSWWRGTWASPIRR